MLLVHVRNAGVEVHAITTAFEPPHYRFRTASSNWNFSLLEFRLPRGISKRVLPLYPDSMRVSSALHHRRQRNNLQQSDQFRTSFHKLQHQK